MNPKTIRGGSGLGDSIYVRPVAEHFVQRGEAVQVLSNYPDVFIGSGAEVKPFNRKADVTAHYAPGKNNPDTTQWDDVCRNAQIGVIPLRFDWSVVNTALVADVAAKAAGRAIILVHGGRTPMGRSDGFGAELLPEKRAFDAALVALDDCFFVGVGKAEQIYPLSVNLNLNGSTTVSDLFDIAHVCNGSIGQCSFIIPLMEVFNKPLLVVWSAKGMASPTRFIRTITPKKVLNGLRSRYVVDDWPDEKIKEAALAFRDLQ